MIDLRARIAGYACLLIVLILAISALGAIRRETSAPARLVRVHFPEVGTLMHDDPVTRAGVPVGKVGSLALDPDRPGGTLVTIELFHRGFIPADSRFVDFNYSLMGSRIVVLVPGRSRLPMDESRVQEGLFAAGIAETVHRVDDLLRLVITLREETVRLFSGPRAPMSPERWRREIEGAMGRMRKIGDQAAVAEKEIRSGMDDLVRAGAATRRALKRSRASLRPAWNRTAGALDSTLAFEGGLEKAFASMEKLLAALEDTSGTAYALLNDRKAYDGLESSLRGLQAVLRLLRDNGLANAIQFRRNVHLNRDKSR